MDIEISSVIIVAVGWCVPELNLLLVVRACITNGCDYLTCRVLNSNICSKDWCDTILKNALDHERPLEWQVRELGTSR